MKKGIIIYAHNNSSIDYVKQAIFCTQQIRKHLKLPVTLITSNLEHLEKNYKKQAIIFDKIISVPDYNTAQQRTFYDGQNKHITDQWKNHLRSTAYELSPYDETLVMDSDYIVCNNNLSKCFKSKEDFLIHKKSIYINYSSKSESKLKAISDTGVDMYWATVFYFKKTKRVKKLFELIQHIKDNWQFYRFSYQIVDTSFRNDFAYSIAIHMINGFQKGVWPYSLPDKLYHITDRDLVNSFNKEVWNFSLAIDNNQYMPMSVKGINIHIMNKFALDKIIDKGLNRVRI
jgi:hypothetical protein